MVGQKAQLHFLQVFRSHTTLSIFLDTNFLWNYALRNLECSHPIGWISQLSLLSIKFAWLCCWVIQSPLFYSLGDNEIGDKGATGLADTLRVNQSLKTLRYLFSDLQCCMFMLIKLRLFHCNTAEQVNFYIIVIFHCSLYHSGLTSTEAIALAKALQQNKSLEELK